MSVCVYACVYTHAHMHTESMVTGSEIVYSNHHPINFLQNKDIFALFLSYEQHQVYG